MRFAAAAIHAQARRIPLARSLQDEHGSVVSSRRAPSGAELVKILAFQAARFAWRPHARSRLPSGDGGEGASESDGDVLAADAPARSACDAVVAFLHAERKDEPPEARDRVLRHATKHLQWLANKRGLKNVVLHSFTHLATGSADAAFAQVLLAELSEKLARKGYSVSTTPFGYTCAWELSVFGESLAKVWKEI